MPPVPVVAMTMTGMLDMALVTLFDERLGVGNVVSVVTCRMAGVMVVIARFV
jgi:hypothetical protein